MRKPILWGVGAMVLSGVFLSTAVARADEILDQINELDRFDFFVELLEFKAVADEFKYSFLKFLCFQLYHTPYQSKVGKSS